jgi:TetR/AcrR family transcriptional regulator, cholesterol catabolism regulator
LNKPIIYMPLPISNMSRKEEIVLRATELFHRQGFIATSLEDIANAIGIKREGIYYYFKDKSEILYAVIKPTSDALLRGLEQVMALPVSAEERLYLAVENHLDQFNSNDREMEIIFRAIYAKERGNRSAPLARTWSAYGELWTELILSGMKAGEFDANLNPRLVSQAMLGSCNTLSTWYDPNGEITLRELVRTYFSVFAYGLCERIKKKDKGNLMALREFIWPQA